VSLWTYLWRGIPAPSSDGASSDDRSPGEGAARDASHAVDGPISTENVEPPRRRVLLYLAMCVLMLLAGAWAVLGIRLPLLFTNYRLGKTYVGEVVDFTAFGVAWMVSGKDLKSVRRFGGLVSSGINALRPAPDQTRTRTGSTRRRMLCSQLFENGDTPCFRIRVHTFTGKYFFRRSEELHVGRVSDVDRNEESCSSDAGRWRKAPRHRVAEPTCAAPASCEGSRGASPGVSRAADLLLGGGPSFDVTRMLQAHQVGVIVPGAKPQLPTVVVVSGVDRPFRQRGVPVIRGSQ
jgi:hypothetical protein